MSYCLLYGLKTWDPTWLEKFWPSQRLNKAAMELGLGPHDWEMRLCPLPEELPSFLENCQKEVFLLRGEISPAVWEGLEKDGRLTVNSAGAGLLARDKLRSASFFNRLGISHPATKELVPEGLQTVGEGREAESLPFPLPFVIKPRYGKMGRGVELIESEAAYRMRDIDTPYIAQEYVKASHGRDIRFFFADWEDGSDFACVERRADGFLSNASQGAMMLPFDPPQNLVSMARKVFKASGLAYGSIDFLIANSENTGFTVCEMNGSPGFEELERCIGRDAARAIIRTLIGQKRKDKHA